MFAQHGANYLIKTQIGGAELHARLWADGGLRKANFMGPGTDLLTRLRRGDKPISGADKVSKAHDLRYTLANGNVAMERKADEMMIAKLKDSKVDNRFNRAMGSLPIRAKVALENKGLFPKGHMSKGPELSAVDRELVQTNLDMLAQEGFGKPGEKLRQLAVMKGCGKLPSPPPNLAINVPPDQIQAIREISLALGVPQRIDEFISKQNLYLWYKSMGIDDADAIQGSFGSERPWDMILDDGVAGAAQTNPVGAEDVMTTMPVATMPVAAMPVAAMPAVAPTNKRKRPTMGKAEFLAKMAAGKAKKKQMTGGCTLKKPRKKRKMHPTTKAKWNKKLKAMLKKYGQGLQLAGALKLAGTGAEDPETFELPETFSADGLETQLGGALKKFFNIEAPADLMSQLGKCMSGGKADWSGMEKQLMGYIPLAS
jgi:hypothetical protein